MSASRIRTALGRTPLNADLGLPPSPSSVNISSLNRLVSSSPVIPSYEQQEFFEEETASNIPSLTREHSLEDELIRNGYSPISKVVVVTPQGNSSVQYIKTQNQLGEPVYVAVDVNDTYVSSSPQDFRMKEVKGMMKIPQEEKEFAFEKAGLGVAGVAFECPTGICTIMHDEHLQAPQERSFALIQTKRVEEVTILASFPVVRMSDIRHNPEACHKNIDLALRRMRNAALDKCVCKINSLQAKMKQLCALLDATLECKENIVKKFKADMCFLEDTYQKCSKCPEKNSCKLKEIAFNIEKRNAMFPHLMESCHEIAQLEKTADEAICQLEKTKHKLNHKFRKLGCVFPLRKKKCIIKCAWEQCSVDDNDSDSDYE